MQKQYELFKAIMCSFIFIYAKGTHEASKRSLSYTSTTSTRNCINYQNNPAYKWCREVSQTANGYFCTLDDSSDYCGGSSNYICSDNQRLTNNSKKLLCPPSSRRCGSQTYIFTNTSDERTFTAQSLNTSYVCWYRLNANTENVKSLNLSFSSAVGSNIEVYTESKPASFKYRGEIANEKYLQINVKNSDYSVWVLVNPSSSGSNAVFMATPLQSESKDNKDGMSKKMIILTIFLTCGGIVLFIVLIILTVCIIKRRLKRKGKNSLNEQDSKAHNQNVQCKTFIKNNEEQFTIADDEKIKDDLNISLPVDLEGKAKNFVMKDDTLKDIKFNRNTSLEFNDLGAVSPKEDEVNPYLNKMQMFEVKVNKSWKYNSPDGKITKDEN